MWAQGRGGKREHGPTCCCSLWGLPRSWPAEAAMRCSGSHSCWSLSGVLGTGLPGLGTEHLPGALCSGTGSPALGLCSP